MRRFRRAKKQSEDEGWEEADGQVRDEKIQPGYVTVRLWPKGPQQETSNSNRPLGRRAVETEETSAIDTARGILIAILASVLIWMIGALVIYYV